MTNQPEALRLADEHDDGHWIVGTKQWCGETAAELRRLHALNQELLEALKCADAMLSGANMNANVVQYKARAAIAKAEGEKQ